MTLAELPAEVLAVLREFRCCEMATVGPDGTPAAWPMVPLLLLDRDQLLLTTSIGFAAKAANVRREPRVSMLFSDPTGSGLSDPPAVLVSGTASVGERVETAGDDLEAHWRLVGARQPVSRWFAASAPGRWFMDWYYMRLLIYVTPRSVLWWPAGETAAAPRRYDLPHVA